MTTRHGRLARTPTSRRDPDVLISQRTPKSQQDQGYGAGNEAAPRMLLHQMAQGLLEQPSVLEQWRQSIAVDRILDWLETFPGDSWQDRWLLSNADAAGNAWGPTGLTPERRGRLTRGLTVMVVLRALRPSYTWLSASRQLGMYAAYRRHNHADVFAAIENHAAAGKSYHEYSGEAVNVLTRIAIATGKHPHAFDVTDFQDYAVARRAAGSKVASLPLAYDLLRAADGLRDQPPTWRQAHNRGQRTVAELVDKYQVTNRDVRDVMVHYLAERSAALDYASLVNLAQVLVDLFWCDLERHHAGISSLHLPEPVAQAWKQRVRVRPDGRKREGVHTVLMAVRAFYLDLRQWALDEPQLWAQWAVPCPVRESDIRGYQKEVRRRQARMQQRTRALIPILPRLLAAAEQELQHAQQLLTATRQCLPGNEFTVGASRYRRGGGTKRHRTEALFVIPVDPDGKRFDAERLEENAFWSFVAVEVMRRTGCRIEELLELTHLSLRQYQAPTGEMVPLLQISPSKTDRERVIPADPELVSVLARIIRRVKNTDGRVPMLCRYDGYERSFGPPLPHLFQAFSYRHQLEVISPNRIREQLKALAGRANITDVDGTPLTFTPHDFRRVFSTETVNSGLPIHIAAKILGHLDLNTTQGYVAVYPEQVIAHYRQFVDLRRTLRPSDEYREPTDQEWGEFRDHFHLRKVALGQCDRPYGTPCQHESACIRCPMLRLEITQVPRLLQIERNHHERLEEAQRMQWLGEVAAIEEGLRHIENKKQQAQRLILQAERRESGIEALG